jgi:hypothetical protein
MRPPTVEELRKMPLTETQWQCPDNFYDAAWENFSHTFEDAVRIHRAPKGLRAKETAPPAASNVWTNQSWTG